MFFIAPEQADDGEEQRQAAGQRRRIAFQHRHEDGVEAFGPDFIGDHGARLVMLVLGIKLDQAANLGKRKLPADFPVTPVIVADRGQGQQDKENTKGARDRGHEIILFHQKVIINQRSAQPLLQAGIKTCLFGRKALGCADSRFYAERWPSG